MLSRVKQVMLRSFWCEISKFVPARNAIILGSHIHRSLACMLATFSDCYRSVAKAPLSKLSVKKVLRDTEGKQFFCCNDG